MLPWIAGVPAVPGQKRLSRISLWGLGGVFFGCPVWYGFLWAFFFFGCFFGLRLFFGCFFSGFGTGDVCGQYGGFFECVFSLCSGVVRLPVGLSCVGRLRFDPVFLGCGRGRQSAAAFVCAVRLCGFG